MLPLTGLGPDAVGDLVADVVGEQRAAEVAAGVHRRTGGNPFFVQQVSWLLHGGQEGIPPGVREALELRFAALPGAAAAALRTAAVIGQRFSADLAALVSGQPSGAVAEALAAAVRARVVSRDGTDAYRFAHDLFREYAYDQLPAAERASLHRRIGQALEASRMAGGEVTLAELATHFVLADPASAQAWEYSVAAAREAAVRLAYEEAVRHWEHAVAATDARPAERTGALLELAEARRRAGQGEAAAQAYLRADGIGPGRAGPGGAGPGRARPARHRHPHLVAPGPGGGVALRGARRVRTRIRRRAAAPARHGQPVSRPGLARARPAPGPGAGGAGRGGRPGGRRPGDAGQLPAGPAPRDLGRGHRAGPAADRRRGGRARRAVRRPGDPARGPPAGRDRPARAGRSRLPRRTRRVHPPGRGLPPAAVPLRRAGPPGRAGPAGRPARRPSG